jgi:chromosome segregation ATPase
MNLSLAIKTDEERLQKLRDELRTLEKEKSAILSEASSQRKALGEIGRDMEEKIAKSQEAQEKLKALHSEQYLTQTIIHANRLEAERQEKIVEGLAKIAHSLEGIAELVESKKGEFEALSRSLAQEKSSFVAVSREKEETIKEISRKTVLLDARESSVLKRETEAKELESSLAKFQKSLEDSKKDIELKKKRMKDYALDHLGLKITFLDDGSFTE